uniref:DUF4125 family protein n=1 Tax=Acetatifactor sp. TaxID=1872090 RepID=UPI004056284C
MNINEILQQIDFYFEQNRGEDAEKLMREAIARAVQEQDDESLLQLLNELLGYYRETSQVDASYTIATQAIEQAKRMGLAGTIPYATTLLNVANAYRAGGRLADSMECYLQVRKIYGEILSSDNMLVASLENNMSLLHQEMGNFAEAKNCLLKALDIVNAKRADFEIAVTYANLASTCMQLKQETEAYRYAKQAVAGFEAMSVEDAHYGAALAALGTYYYEKKEYAVAKEYFHKAMEIMEQCLGRNEYYERLRENVEACESRMSVGHETGQMSGLALCRAYYEAYGKPMLEQQFPDYVDKIAVGLVGEGSDCFGFDDEFSRDHDWGPDFCMWVTDETYAEIGEALEQAYRELPDEFMGCKRILGAKGRGRRGVQRISAFYERFLQTSAWKDIHWQQVADASLAAAVNGEIYRDEEGVFCTVRDQLKQGYPEEIRYLKLAESAARFSQAGQYNYERMLRRGDKLTAQMMLADGIREAMKLQHYIEGKYPPHDKWLYRSLQDSEGGRGLAALLAQLSDRWDGRAESGEAIDDKAENQKAVEVSRCIEQIAEFLTDELYERNFISDSNPYLDAHTDELLYKAVWSGKTNEELVDRIAELEFEAFDKVRNVGGRASCQNDWATFSIMRKSQYLTWNRTMLLQYLYDFETEYRKGHNLITEKYGRMMESTAPEEYERIKEHFPEISEEKQAIIGQIVQVQVSWMEEFASRYPYLAENARSVRSAEDNLYNTSYETYLRGEISTYSDKMLELYGRYVVEYAVANKNLAFDIMENSVHLYGYRDLEAAERFLGL